MRGSFILSVVLSVAVLVACSEHSEEAKPAPPATAEPQHIWKDQVQALDKAKQVEQTIMDAQQRRDLEMEQQRR